MFAGPIAAPHSSPALHKLLHFAKILEKTNLLREKQCNFDPQLLFSVVKTPPPDVIGHFAQNCQFVIEENAFLNGKR